MVETMHQSSTTALEVTALSFLEVANRLRVDVDRALQPLGLDYRKYRVLVHFGGSVGGRVDGSRTLDVVSDLETEGMVRRVRDGGERVELTPLGRERASAAGVRIGAVAADLRATWSAPDRMILGRLLEKVKCGETGSSSGGSGRL